jgi:hypothetical protein
MRMTLLFVVLVLTALAARANPVPADSWPPLSREELARHLVVVANEDEQFVTYRLLRHQPMSDNDLITPWIVANANRLQPMFLAELARRLFAENQNLALDWYLIGLTRARYDEGRCIERTTRPTDTVDRALRDPDGIAPVVAEGPDAVADAYARVLRRPDLLSDDVAPEWGCWSGYVIDAEDVVSRPRDTIVSPARPVVRPKSDWPQIRQAVLEDTAARASGKLLGGPPRPGRVIKHLAADARIGVAWSPDGAVIATAGESTIALWDAETGQRLGELAPAEGFDVLEPPSFTEDGQDLFFAEGNRVASDAAAIITLWDRQTGHHRKLFDALRGSGRFAVAAKHRMLALDMTGPDEDSVIFLFRIVGRAVRLGTLITGGYNPPEALAFAPDGKVLAVALSKEILLFDVVTGTVLRRIRAYEGEERPESRSFAYSPDGAYLAVGSYAVEQVTRSAVRIWKAEDGSLLRALPGDDLAGLGWAPDGRYVTRTERGSSLRFWDVVSGASTEIATRWDGNGPLAFSPDGKKVVAGARDGAEIIEVAP